MRVVLQAEGALLVPAELPVLADSGRDLPVGGVEVPEALRDAHQLPEADVLPSRPAGARQAGLQADQVLHAAVPEVEEVLRGQAR